MSIKRFFAVGVLATFTASVSAAELLRSEQPIEGQYIVVLKDESSVGAKEGRAVSIDAAQMANEMAATYNLEVDRVYQHALKGFSVAASEADIKELLKDERVEFVEEDGVSFLSVTQSGATWGLDRVDQRDRPLNGTYIYNTTASNVRVYVIDSGIRATHNLFGGRVEPGATAINDGRGSSDCNGHGTHVAGTVGSSTYGVAKGVRLIPVRVFGCSGGSANSTIIAGIDYVRSVAIRPAVANMSLGGPASSAIDSATNNLVNSGVTVVVAAGNENQNACNVSPARVSNAITVGATTSSDARASFSNWGSCVNIFGPGQSITSTWYTSNSATQVLSGTSMASPHVAGAAALVLAGSPSASPATVRNTLYNKATTNRISNVGSGSPNRLLYTR